MTHRLSDVPVEQPSTPALSESAPLVDLSAADTNSSIKQMSPKTVSGDDWFEVVDNEKERNADGRPDPYAYTEKQALDKQLSDTEGLSKTLLEKFDQWDANHDGILAPIELENIYTSDSASTEDKTAAAAIRLKYHQFADLRLPNMGSDSSFITQPDLDVLGVLYDEDKKDAAFDQYYKGVEDAAYEKVGDDRTYFTDALMYGAGLLDYYFVLPGQFDDKVDSTRQDLEAPPPKGSDLDLCLPETKGECRIY